MTEMNKHLKLIRYFLQEKKFSEAEEELSALEMVFENSLIHDLNDSIQQQNSQKGILLIEEYLNSDMPVSRHEKINIEGLKTSIRLLETELSVLHYKKAELLKLIKIYRTRYYEEIAGIVGELLRLRTEILYRQFLQSTVIEDEYLKSEKESEEFHKASIEQRKEILYPLTPLEKKELQIRFRRASKLCHPDLITEKLKENAALIFIELSTAYYRNDLLKVTEILEMLQSKENYFAKITEEYSETESFRQIETKLRADIDALKLEINNIETLQAYRTIKEIKDWDAHFSSLKEKFDAEISRLKEENRDDG